MKNQLNIQKEKKRDNRHSVHKYYGKILPAIASWAIEEFSSEGETIYDPFSGSGTVALESKINNRNFKGVDINPLSVKIAKLKTGEFDQKEIISDFEYIIKHFHSNESNEEVYIYNGEHWFDKSNLVQMKKINVAIREVINKDFFLAILSSIIKNASYADPSHVFPGKSKRMVKKIEGGYVAPQIIELFEKKVKKILSNKKYFEKSNSKISFRNISSVDTSSFINKNEIDLIITNPPYISSIRYEEATKLELYGSEEVTDQSSFLKLSRKFTGTEKYGKKTSESLTTYGNKFIEKIDSEKNKNTVNRYFVDLEKVVKDWARIVKPGGKVVIKIGDSVLSRVKIPTGEIISSIAQDNNFKEILFTKDKIGQRSFTSNRNTYSGIIIYDNIIVLEKQND